MTPDKDKYIDLNTPEADRQPRARRSALPYATAEASPIDLTAETPPPDSARGIADESRRAAMLLVITTVRPISRAFTSRARTCERRARAHSHLSPRHQSPIRHRRRGRRNRARNADTAARRTRLAMFLLLFVPWKMIEKYLFRFQKLPPREVKHSPPRWMIWREKNSCPAISVSLGFWHTIRVSLGFCPIPYPGRNEPI